MTINVNTLTERQWTLLQAMAHETGQSPEDLIAAAVEQLIRQFQEEPRLMALRQARGMWQNRADLPPLETLRREWERL